MRAEKLAKVPVIVTRAAATYALLGGLLSFAGWVTGTYRLTDWIGAGITIKANTSLAIAAAAAALMLLVAPVRGKAIVRVLSAFVAVVGGATLLEHVSDWDLGIDTLLFDEPPGAAATAAPNRMGPPASTSLLAIGIALVLRTCSAPARRFGSALGLAVLGIGMLSLTGHWYGAETMYTIPRLTGIAAQTATMLVALGVGIIAANPDWQPMRTLVENSIAGQLARRLVPFVIGVPLVLGWVRLKGQQFELYDAAFGTAIRTIVEVILFSALVWWSVRAIQARDTQRRRAEDDLRLSEQRLVQTLAGITDGFVTLDREWRFTYVNPQAERFMGHPASRLLGTAAWSVFPEVVGTELQRELQRAMDERVVAEIESTRAGRYFNNRVFPASDGGISVYIQDVTARKEAQAALSEADRRKDEFIATLAHELRNPLAPIRNAARLLEAKGAADPTIEWATKVVSRQVQHTARLLDDLLDVSRITLNRLELRREWVDVAEIVSSVSEASRPTADAAGHELIVELPAEPVFVDGDAVRLSQVLANLLTNAVKYTERGGRIRVTLRCVDADALISVSDDGIGIPRDMLQQIFDMFVQGHSHSHQWAGGLGIGLWLAKAVVEQHGGRIEARSDGLGKGSEFVVRLPLLAGLTGGAAALPESPPQNAPSRRVLVVDDLRDSADTLALLLESLGHVVKTAYGGEEALLVGSRFHPDAIFLDIGMPDVDGFEACRRIRKTAWGRSVCIIALTGWGQAADRRRTEEAGFDLHLIKPVDPGALPSLLNDMPKGIASAAL